MPVAIINSEMVKKNFPNVDPLTQRLVIDQLIPGVTDVGPSVTWQIVGVYENVRNGGPQGEGFSEVDVPFAQSPWPGVSMAVRTAGDPNNMSKSIAAVIRSVDPDLPMANVKSMDHLLEESVGDERFSAALFGGFALIALALAAFGIYGVMSFAVAQRTREIGLRMALGAGEGQVLKLIMKEGMSLGIIGLLIGLARLLRNRQADEEHAVRHRLHRWRSVQRGRGDSHVVGADRVLHSRSTRDARRPDGGAPRTMIVVFAATPRGMASPRPSSLSSVFSTIRS